MTKIARYISIYEPRVCVFCGRGLHKHLCAPLRALLTGEKKNA